MAASGDDKSLSYFQKTVCLDEWWLIRAETEIEGKRIAVAGFTSREGQAVRGFSSAPVLKRHDVFTLETTDGICVMIKGFINKARTLENGFPSEVFSHFVFGFPPHWEACAEKFLGQGFATENVSKVDASTIDSSEVTKENCEKANAEKTTSLSASVADPKLDQDHGDIMIQEGSKKSNKAVRYSSRVGGAENNDPKKIAGAEKESTLKEACAEKFLGQGFASEDVINVDASTMDSSEVTKENYEKVITEKTVSLSPCVAAPKLDQDRRDIMIQEVSKKSNKAVRFSGRLGGAENKDRKKIAGAEKESTLNEASTAVKKTKRKLTYGSPVTPRGEDLVSVVSPESFSCKRSRSDFLDE